MTVSGCFRWHRHLHNHRLAPRPPSIVTLGLDLAGTGRDRFHRILRRPATSPGGGLQQSLADNRLYEFERGVPVQTRRAPNTRVGVGAGNQRAAAAIRAWCAVGHDTPYSAATSATARFEDAIAVATWS